MIIKYQLILLGGKNRFKKRILDIFFLRMKELGIRKDSLTIMSEYDFYSLYRSNAPTYCLFFGSKNAISKEVQLVLNILIKNATLILPIVSSLTKFTKFIPKELHTINGFELKTEQNIEKLVSSILEGLSLLRHSRRIFISYKRNESSAIAIQLYEQLEKNNFDVFLDTHSVKPGEIFQEELWHRMADTDVVLMLNTPNFLKSYWTTQELAKANAMSIGIIQLIWPEHELEEEAMICLPYHLVKENYINKDFNNVSSKLKQKTIDKVLSQVESLRARSLAARQNNIITEFITYAKKISIIVSLLPQKVIVVKSRKCNDYILVIPTIGVPQTQIYNKTDYFLSLIKTKKIKSSYILYDHRNIREKWVNHLSWLDSYLPMKTLKITEAESWLKRI